MGFLVIIPFGALAVWSIVKIFLRLERGHYKGKWWQAFWLLALAGSFLGIWLAFFTHYQVANRRLEGFPIPTGISSREKPGDPWLKSTMPVPVRAGGILANLLSGVALCLAPVAVAAFFKEHRTQPDLSGHPRV